MPSFFPDAQAANRVICVLLDTAPTQYVEALHRAASHGCLPDYGRTQVPWTHPPWTNFDQGE
jgi:hypothetical protein